MFQAAEAYTTPVVRLARAVDEPVKQPRQFRRYRKDQGITYLPRHIGLRDDRADPVMPSLESAVRAANPSTLLLSAFLQVMDGDGYARVHRRLSESCHNAPSPDHRAATLKAIGVLEAFR